MRIPRVAFALPLLALPLVNTGCASLAFRPGIQSVGEYKNTLATAEKADDMPNNSADEVKVLIQTLPPGMAVKDGELVYDHQRYEMLGKVSADYKEPGGVNLGWWIYHYQDKDSWRKGLCYWQVPLSWVTLSMWSYFVPLYYPCRVKFGEEEERRASVVETLQRTTKALGGNLVIVAGFGGIDFITVRGNVVVGSSDIGTLRGAGYAFKVNGVGPALAPAVNVTKL